MNKSIYIYKDEGVGLVNAQKLRHAFLNENFASAYRIDWIDRNGILNKEWENHTAALIFPGGRDLPYHERLKGSPNARIQSYVINGGCYIGICAGAYYGSSYVEFDLGYPLEVVGTRELQFFPGIARGPAFGKGTFCYNSEKGACIAKLKFSDQSILSAYYNGGCYFANAELYSNVQIVARYMDIQDEPPAIVQCKVGKGLALLSGVHPEVSPSLDSKALINLLLKLL